MVEELSLRVCTSRRYRASAIYLGRYPARAVSMRGHLPEVGTRLRPFTGSRYPPGEVPCVGHLPGEVPCVGHLPEVGTRPGRYPPGECACVGHFYRGGGYPWREVPHVGHLPESGSLEGGTIRRPFTGKRIPTGGCMHWPFTEGRYRLGPFTGGRYRLRPCQAGHRPGRMDGIMESMETKHM